MVRALLIEARPDVRARLAPYAEPLDLDLYAAASLADGRRMIAALKPALNVVDRELPDGDGLDLIAEACAGGAHAVVVSERNQTSDRVAALKFGADEYFGKPVDAEELYLKLRKLMARGLGVLQSQSVVHEFAGVKVDLSRRALLDPQGGAGPELTETELAVLRALADHADQVVDRAALYAAMSGVEALDPTSRAVDTCVSRLRLKLRSAESGVEIRSLRQVGYVLRRERDPRDRARRV